MTVFSTDVLLPLRFIRIPTEDGVELRPSDAAGNNEIKLGPCTGESMDCMDGYRPKRRTLTGSRQFVTVVIGTRARCTRRRPGCKCRAAVRCRSKRNKRVVDEDHQRGLEIKIRSALVWGLHKGKGREGR